MDRPVSLVTGACGFMGTHMVEILHAAGHQVRATDLAAAHERDDREKGRFPSVIDRLGVEFVPSDMTRPETLEPLLKGVDYVFHIAAVFSYSAPWEVLRKVNADGTVAMLEMLRGNKRLRRLVLWGAGGVYGLPSWRKEKVLDESMGPLPVNNYLRSKWLAEFAVMEEGRKHGLSWAIMRPTTVYGPRAVYGSGPMIMQAAGMKVAAMPKNMTARIPWVHVRDVCSAALHLAVTPGVPSDIYNLNDDTQMGTSEFFKYVAGLTGHKYVELPAVPLIQMKPAIRAFAGAMQWIFGQLGMPSPVEADTVDYVGEDWAYSNDRLKATGYKFIYPDARDGLRDTIAWYRENGWMKD